MRRSQAKGAQRMTTSPSDPQLDPAALDEIERIARDLARLADTEGPGGADGADDASDWTNLAMHHANLVASEPLKGRLIPARRLASRFVWPTVARSLEATRATVHAVEDLNRRLEDAESGRAEAVSSAAAAAQSAHAAVERAEAAAAAAAATSERLRQQVEIMQRQLDATSAELRRQRSQSPARQAPAPAPPTPEGEAPGTPALTSSFYTRFEERFRGSRDDIRELLREHLPVALEAVGSDGTLLDLGSGRGEWLELLTNAGASAYGVDTSEDFVAAAEELGLDLRLEDAVRHLRSLEPGSLAAVTAFHLVEHLPLDDLVALLDAALEALRPGGLLLLETPNPLNVTVGAATFWLDPTHLRPLHPGLLSLLVEERGFAQAEVRYLHPERLPEPGTISGQNAWLLQRAADALVGPQDYAVVARRLTIGAGTHGG
jgi:SAM-dependent methyltransferase